MNCVAYSIYSQTLLTTTGSGVPIRKTEKTRPKRRVRIPSRTHLNGFSHPISRTPADKINCIIISPPGQQVSVPGPMGLGQKNTPNRGLIITLEHLQHHLPPHRVAKTAWTRNWQLCPNMQHSPHISIHSLYHMMTNRPHSYAKTILIQMAL